MTSVNPHNRMKTVDKLLYFSEHAKEQLTFRGTNEEEITAAIRTSPWEAAELGRRQCKKTFPYNKNWNNKKYATKQVKPIFTEENDTIVVITVYVYFF